jgi:uncharacterized membrane protein
MKEEGMANFHVLAGTGDDIVRPTIRRIRAADLMMALRDGFDDFMQKPSHYAFLCLIYPIVGIVLAMWTSGNNALPLLYPLVSGFALIGPFAALGLYEISRRREAGLDTSWKHAFEVLQSPAIPSILAVGVGLFVLFYLWLATAETLYQSLFGLAAPDSLWGFLGQVFGTSQGWTLIIWGNLLGLLFALVTLCTTVIAFPLLIDRDVGAFAAITTSLRAVAANPGPMLLWGLIVAIALLIGSIPLFVGLAIVVPVLGHATWHLYRRLVG